MNAVSVPPSPPTLAIISDWAGNNYYADAILDEATRTAHEHGANVIWLVDRVSTADLNGTGPRMFDMIRPGQAHAVLIVSFGHAADPTSVAAYCERFRSLPVCTLTTPIEGCSQVLIENGAGMRDAVRHLVDVHGYRRIAFVRGPHSSSEAESRYAAYARVLAERGIPLDPELTVTGDFSLYSGLVAARQLLDRDLALDAVVCANDGMAFGMLQELQERGISVPGELAVVGFDDSEVARGARPPLTSVRQPSRRQARLAVELLFDELAGKPVLPQSAIASELVVRRSCGCTEARELERLAHGSAPPQHDGDGRVERWADELSTALAADLRAPGSTQLVTTVRDLLEHTLHDGGMNAIQRGLSIARSRRARSLESDSSDGRLDRLVEKARMVIALVAEQDQATQRLEVEEQTRKLNEVNRKLTATVSVESLTELLAAQTSWLEIPSLYLCLYERSQGALSGSRLVLAVRNGQRLPLPAGGVLVPVDHSLPAEYLAADPDSTHIYCSLDRSIAEGYVVFERGVRKGLVYDALSDQISAALLRVRILERLVEEGRGRETAERERLEKEMHLARQIQTGILPRTIHVEGLEISATMLPASEVGGDYYEVLPASSGCWLGIGDVSGHGLPAGLVMMMLQSVVSGLVRSNPDQAPRDMLRTVNQVLFENVRVRMGQDEHATLSLFHYDGAGSFVFAGAHEAILICRAATGAVEWIETPGTWVGILPNIDAATTDAAFQLDAGDLMLLYTDGATEARNEHGEMFGEERMAAIVCELRHAPVSMIRDALVDALKAWMARQEDDITLVVVRRAAGQVPVARKT